MDHATMSCGTANCQNRTKRGRMETINRALIITGGVCQGGGKANMQSWEQGSGDS
jgi:hypothetical protein